MSQNYIINYTTINSVSQFILLVGIMKLIRILRIREAGIILALVAIAGFTASLNPQFISGYNLQLLSRQIAIFGILAIGEMFVIITAGVDLAPGSIVAMTCILTAWFMTHGLGIIGSIMMTLVISAIIGISHGLFVSKLRIPPFIITLCTFLIARGIGGAITKGWPIINLPPIVSLFWGGDILKIPIPVIILIVIVGISVFILRFSPLGRHIYAVGGNIEAARLSGIDVDKTRIIVYTISSILAGIVGLLHTAWLEQGNVNVGQFYELYAIAATVIGGTSLFGGVGTILGTIIGASILSTIWNSMLLLEVSAYWQNVVLGIVIITAITFDTLRKRGN
ncbi:MAG: transporter permease [Candidatus Poribacteria bacterium]|nr:transporter permease [Candidatus Poribacteria bacterium]